MQFQSTRLDWKKIEKNLVEIFLNLNLFRKKRMYDTQLIRRYRQIKLDSNVSKYIEY